MKKYSVLFLLINLLLLSGCTRKYTVKIIATDGTLLSSHTVVSGDNIKNIEPPKKEGYIFVTYKKNGKKFEADTPIHEDIILNPYYTEIPKVDTLYKVNFNFGNYQKSQNVKEHDKVVMPPLPEEDGYKFLGWYLNDELYDFDSEVTSDLELIAKYEKTKLTITFDLDGGVGPKYIMIDKGNRIPIPKAPDKLGYHFLGWYLDDILYNFNDIIYEDITLRARWQVADYVKVSFDSDGGTLIDSILIEKDTCIDKLISPSKNNYIFDYWSVDGKKFDRNMPIDRDIILKAIYKKDKKS